MRTTLPTYVVALCVATFTLSSAYAQDSGLGDPRILSPSSLGPAYSGLTGAGLGLVSKKPLYGVEAGDFVLQPRFFVEGAYQTNFFRVDSRQGTPEGVFSMHVRPGVALFNPNFKTVALSLGLDVDVWVPFGNEDVTDKTNVGGVLDLAISFFPKSALTLTLHEDFERTLWTRPLVTANANRIKNRAGAELSFHPGGRALDFSLKYTNDLVRYDDLERLNTDGHEFAFMASWRFYPMTYAFLEAMMTVTDYSEAATADETASTGNYVPGLPVKAYLGLSGFITERLALLVRAGYGNSLLDRGDDFSSFIGQLQASYRFGPKSIIHAGAARDFELSPLGGQYDYIRFYGSFEQRIGEIVDIHIDASYDIRGYGAWVPAAVTIGNETVTPTASDPERSESVLRAGVLLDFDVSRIFGVTLGYRFDSVISDYSITTGAQTNLVGYDDHRVFASLNLRY